MPASKLLSVEATGLFCITYLLLDQFLRIIFIANLVDNQILFMTISQSKSSFLIYLLIIFLPFLVLYWLVPFLSNLTIGNDYQGYGIRNQMELLFSIKTGSFPLYSPGYALGQSSIALTWSQIFHPISYLASLMPGYWGGKALHWHTFIKLLSLGFTHIVLFIFLRKININILFSFLISFITVYNLRMLDLIRFGPALEAYTAHLLLCAAIGWYFIHPSRWIGPLGIIITTYLVVVSGHPQMMYYGLLGSGIFLLVAPYFIRNILPEIQNDSRSIFPFWIKSGFFIMTGIVLSAVYILPFYFDFYATNIVRVGTSYEWSLGTQSFFGVLSNFFLPFLSDVHGAFGGSSIILLAAILPLLQCFKIKIPHSIWMVWGILLILFLFMLGQKTPVHKWAWEYLPFLSAFRNPGRISMIIPIFLMMLLAWTTKNDQPSFSLRRLSMELTPYSLLALIGLFLIPLNAVIYYFFRPALGFLPPITINHIPSPLLIFILCSGMLSLILLILYGRPQRAAGIIGILLSLATIVQVSALLRYGTFIVPVKEWPTFEQMRAEKQESLDYRYHDLPGMQSSAVMEQINNSFFEPFLGKIFTQIIPVESRDDAYNKMEHERLPQQLFIEGYPPEKANALTEKSAAMKTGMVDLTYSSFNRMIFNVNTQAPAFFGFSYPYTGNWEAWVNGEKVPTYRANGAAHGVEIPAGDSLVEFRYWSNAFFWGMLISCSTFAGIGIFACFRKLSGLPKAAGIVIVLIISYGGFMLWYNSLYNGENLETEYTWTYSPPLKTPNLAYGKKTSGFELPSTSYLNRHRSRAVDRDTTPETGFTLEPNDNKKLIVDLNQPEKIKQILLYGSSNTLPLIYLSQDGNQWHKTTSPVPRSENGRNVFRIDLKRPLTAQFIKVEASMSDLQVNELEVYGAIAFK